MLSQLLDVCNVKHVVVSKWSRDTFDAKKLEKLRKYATQLDKAAASILNSIRTPSKSNLHGYLCSAIEALNWYDKNIQSVDVGSDLWYLKAVLDTCCNLNFSYIHSDLQQASVRLRYLAEDSLNYVESY